MIFKQVDLVDITAVDSLVSEADVVVRYSHESLKSMYMSNTISHQCVTSLLPVPFHPTVAKLCITHKKHMVTASYMSQAMRELHEALATFHITCSWSLTNFNVVR